MNFLDRIKGILINQGYRIININIPRKVTWRPDIFAKKGKELIAYIVRESKDIPEILVHRIAGIKVSQLIRKIILFRKKPDKSVIKLIALYQIGACYLCNNRLIEIVRAPSLKRLAKLPPGRKQLKPMPKTNVFISSHQVIDEREMAKQVTKNLREIDTYPLYAVLVEDDSRYPRINQTRRCIDANMQNSNWFVGVLAEQYRPIVDREVKKAIKKLFMPDNVFIFIKSTREGQHQFKRLIEWIKKQRTIKYFNYSDVRDFEIKLTRALRIRYQKVCKRLGVSFDN